MIEPTFTPEQGELYLELTDELTNEPTTHLPPGFAS